MVKRWSYRLLCCVITLVVAGIAHAQVTHCEYWFDNDFAGRQTLPWDGDANGGMESQIETDGVGFGLHRLNVRVRRADGRYSPVTTHSFVKLNDGAADAIEYWLDGDYAHRASVAWDSAADSLSLSLEPLLGSQRMSSVGLLRLQFRAVIGSSHTPVYSATTFKHSPHDESFALEYWLDDSHTDRKSITLTPGDSLFRVSLSDVPLGAHLFHTRTFFNGTYSPVSSSLFFMGVSSDKPAFLEYWFDDDAANSMQMDISSNDSIVTLPLPNHVKTGLHRLHARIMSDDFYSPIYSSWVWRTPGNAESKLEYWFDDDYANRSEQPIDSRDSLLLVDSGLDLTADSLSMGMHRLSMRLAVNGDFSPVTTQWVLNGMSGRDVQMEYWLDGDFEHRGTVSPSASGSVVAFADELNLSAAIPGIHTLHYRVADLTGAMVGPSDSTQVMVLRADKGDVNQDGSIDVGDVPALVSFIFGREKPTYSFGEADQNEDDKIQVNDLVMLVNVILDHREDKAPVNPARLASASHSDGMVSLNLDTPQMFTGVQFDVQLADGQRLSRITTGDAGHSYMCRMMDGHTARVVVYSTKSVPFQGTNAVSLALGGGTTGEVTITNIRLADLDATTISSEPVTLSEVTAVQHIASDEADGPGNVYSVSGIRLTNDGIPVHGSDIPVIYIRDGRKELRQ